METTQALEIPGMSFVDIVHTVSAMDRLFGPGEIPELFARGEKFLGTDLRVSGLSAGFRSFVLDALEAGYETPTLMRGGIRSLGLYTVDRGMGDGEIVRTVGKSRLTTFDDLLDIFLKPLEERNHILLRGVGVTNLLPMQLRLGSRMFCVNIRIRENHVLFGVGHGKCEKNSRLILSHCAQPASPPESQQTQQSPLFPTHV